MVQRMALERSNHTTTLVVTSSLRKLHTVSMDPEAAGYSKQQCYLFYPFRGSFVQCQSSTLE